MPKCPHPASRQLVTAEGHFCLECGHLVPSNNPSTQSPFAPKAPQIKNRSAAKSDTAAQSKPKPTTTSRIQPHRSVRISVADIQSKPTRKSKRI